MKGRKTPRGDLGEEPPSRVSSKCKGPEALVSSGGQGRSEKTSMAVTKREKGPPLQSSSSEPQSVFGDILGQA